MAPAPAPRPLLHRLIREPLLHFVLAGLVFFLAAQHHRRETDFYRIVVTPERIAQLKSSYIAEFGSPPDPKMLERLVSDHVGEEMLFREGRARGLDREDEIVRRRIVQKMRFLADEEAPPAPDEQALRQWYAAHRQDYASAGAAAFSHVFFADGAGGQGASKQRAQAVLASLPDTTQRAPELGDSFPDLSDFSGFGPDQARRLFGDSELAGALFRAPLGHWAGPYRSAYGWHLVRLASLEPASVQPFEEVRAAVLADAGAAARKSLGSKELERIRAKFTVVREDRR